MKSWTLIFAFLFFAIAGNGFSQSNAEMVYSIFQSNCTNSSCHNNIDLAAGLNLEAVGATLADKITAVRNAMYDAPSANSYSVSKGYRIIYPADPYRSTLFRKVHHGFDNTVSVDSAEGENMPSVSQSLRKEEIELIRQWIFFDAPVTGNPVDTNLIYDYYNGSGFQTLTTIPDEPAPGEGFQVHLGPFFLAPSAEEEYFWKYRTDLPTSLEITAVAPDFGTYSHHFILNRFQSKSNADGYEYGLRGPSSHFDADLVAVYQFADTLQLPDGTAFTWSADSYLDFNSHHINYSSTDVMACDVYLNVYTQPTGTAIQIMNSTMVPNFAINIPNDNNPYTFEFPYFNPFDPATHFVWSVTSHTHKYGTMFQVYTRNSDGSKDDLIYDASYKDGNPSGLFIGYDYQHPPQRFYYPFLPVHVNKGIVFRASYVNFGPDPVSWGSSSDDEMMLLIYYYVSDTAGLSINIDQSELNAENIYIYPNPADEILNIASNSTVEDLFISLYDMSGKKVLNEKLLRKGEFLQFSVSVFNDGLYLLKMQSENGNTEFRKILIRHE